MYGSGGARDGARPDTGRFEAGDGIRGIGLLGTIVLHSAAIVSATRNLPGLTPDEASGQYVGVAGAASPLIALTRVGIFLFFALSGYLISRRFLAAYLTGTRRPDLRRYASDRVLRIVPAFWLLMIVYLTWDHAWRAGGLDGTIAAFGFAQNYDVTKAAVLPQAWTLDLEVAFYALVPIVALCLPALGGRHRRLLLVLALVLLAFVASLTLKHDAGRPVQNTYDIAQYLFAFLPGVALAAIEPFVGPWLRSRATGHRWARAALALSVTLLTLEVYAPPRQHGLHLLLATLGCGSLLAAALTLQWSTGRCWWVFRNRPIQWVGERSYGAYLIHLGLVGHLMARLGHHGPRLEFVLLAATTAALSMTLADLLWRTVERPILRRRERAGAGPSTAAGARPHQGVNGTLNVRPSQVSRSGAPS